MEDLDFSRLFNLCKASEVKITLKLNNRQLIFPASNIYNTLKEKQNNQTHQNKPKNTHTLLQLVENTKHPHSFLFYNSNCHCSAAFAYLLVKSINKLAEHPVT